MALKTSGTSQYTLEFVDGGGNKVSVPIAKSPSGSLMLFGDTDKPFINRENASIVKDAYFVVTDGTRKRGERNTYVLQYKGADKTTADNPVLKFKNLGSGDTIEQTYTNASPLATLKVGGADYKVYAEDDPTRAGLAVNDFALRLDLDASGALDNAANQNRTINITTKYGAEIGLSNVTAATTSA